MQRTIRIHLYPSSRQSDALAETGRQFTSAFNQAVRLGWDADVCNATKLHYLAYYPLKTDHPTLVSDLINQARVKAAEALRSAFALRKQGRKVGLPQAASCPPRYNVHTYRVDWESQTVRMSLECGVRLNADLNAARNIAAKYRAGGGTSPTGGLPVNQPIVSDPACRVEAQAAPF